MDFFFHKVQHTSTKREPQQPDGSVFEERGQELFREIRNDSFCLKLYRSKHAIPFFREFENGGFIVVLGTLFYRNRYASGVLEELYRDFCGKGLEHNELRGHYGVLIYRDSRLYVFNDYLGQYRIVHNESMDVVSSSFLALSRSVGKKSLDLQVVYEYLLRGGVFGEESMFREVKHLPSFTRTCIYGKDVPVAMHYELPIPDYVGDFQRMLEHVREEMLQWFGLMVETFGDRIAVALSGGYDSRNMLACLRNLGADPFVYVYGGPSTPDVVQAKRMADGEGFALHHTDKSLLAPVEPDAFGEVLYRNYLHFDGYSEEGIMDNGMDVATRFSRTEGGRLQLNGAAGEIHRNVWQLDARSRSPENLSRHLFDIHDYSLFKPPFEAAEFMERITAKMSWAIGFEGKKMSRADIEMTLPYWRIKYWQSIATSINSRISPTLIPFIDHRLVIPSFHIPIRHKFNGRFQAALIQSLDPALASYPSNYGHALDSLPLRARMNNLAYRSIPAWLKPRLKAYRFRQYEERPYFMEYAFMSEVLDMKNNRISEIVNFTGLNKPPVLNRAYSLAYLFEKEM